MPGKAQTLSKADAGRLGARRRWGPQRVVRLDELDSRVAAAVRALIQADAAANEKAGPVIETTGTGREARRASGEPTTA